VILCYGFGNMWNGVTERQKHRMDYAGMFFVTQVLIKKTDQVTSF
jgi:hypothetical protein